MKALELTELGEPGEVLTINDSAIPAPGHGQIRVKVAASPASFPDVLMCRGGYQIKPAIPSVLGIEVAGWVDELGDGVDNLAVGDRIVGLTELPHGGFAEYAICDSTVTFPAPTGMGAAEASSMFVAYQTGWFGLHRRAHLKPGETVLVHAAAGGVGSAAVELSKAAGCTVIAVVGNADKVAIAEKLGADVVVNRRDQDFVEIANEVTAGRGVDVVYDPVGGESYTRSTKCIASEGRIIVLGFASGEIQTARLNHALIKNYSIVGFVWGRFRRNDPQSVVDCHNELLKLADAGKINPLVGERLSLENLPAGMDRLAAGESVGRVVYVNDEVEF